MGHVPPHIADIDDTRIKTFGLKNKNENQKCNCFEGDQYLEFKNKTYLGCCKCGGYLKYKKNVVRKVEALLNHYSYKRHRAKIISKEMVEAINSGFNV